MSYRPTNRFSNSPINHVVYSLLGLLYSSSANRVTSELFSKLTLSSISGIYFVFICVKHLLVVVKTFFKIIKNKSLGIKFIKIEICKRVYVKPSIKYFITKPLKAFVDWTALNRALVKFSCSIQERIRKVWIALFKL